MEETKFWLLLARIFQKSKEPNESLEVFSKAKEMQNRYVSIIDSWYFYYSIRMVDYLTRND